MPKRAPSKRNDGDGTVLEKNGRVVIRTMFGHLPSGRPRILSVSGKTLKEARAAQLKLQLRYARGQIAQEGRISLTDWVQDYTDEIAGGLSPATQVKHKSYVKLIQNNPTGQIHLRDLRVQHLEALYRDLARTKSKSTVSHVRNIIHRALKKATRYEMIPTNPAEAAEMPRMKVTPISRAMTEAELAHFFTTHQHHRDINLWATIATLGLRHSEALALTWAMLTEDDHGPILHVPGTKNDNAKRETYVPDDLLPYLDAQREQNRLDADINTPYAKNDLIFPSTAGTIRERKVTLAAFRRALKAAGIEHPYRIHDLRATFITHQIAHGVDPRTVAASVGHSDPRTTLAVYSHVVTTKARAAARTAGARLPAAATTPAPPPQSAYGRALRAALQTAQEGVPLQNRDVRAAHPDLKTEDIGAALASRYFTTLKAGGRGRPGTYQINAAGLAQKKKQQ